MELNREQIIKAMECCTSGDCYPCPYGNIGAGCGDRKDEDALALIKELTEELTHKETAYNELYELTTEEIKDLYAERDRLTEENERLIAELAKACKALDEMRDRLKQAVCDNTYPDFNREGKPVNIWKATTGYDLIDQIAKEVINEQCGN